MIDSKNRIAELAEILAAGLQRVLARQSSHFFDAPEKVLFTSRPSRAVLCLPVLPRPLMTDPVLAQLAALKGATANALKDKWRALFDTEPPPYNRRFLESRLANGIRWYNHPPPFR
jgi:hypothetical protein